MGAEFMRQCGRWTVCSVNSCPLDEQQSLRSTYREDPEKACKEHPRARMGVAQKAKAAGVKLSGLTDLERQRIEAGETLEAIYAEADAKKLARLEHMGRMRKKSLDSE